MSDPIVDTQFGIVDWKDYVNNWREKDAEYLQARTIPRFANAGTRDTGIPSPSPGQFVYDQNLDILEMRSKTNAWVPYRALPLNLLVPTDDGTSVILSHSTAAGKGVVFGASTVGITGNLNVLNGLHTVDPTGMTIKSGSRVAKLSTDTANLISDTPLSVPSIALTGTGTVISAAGKALAIGTLTADAATITNISMSGTLTGGVINGSSGLIGGVNHTAGGNLSGAGAATLTGGFISQFGVFYGDSASAVMRWRNTSGGALGSPYVQTTQNEVNLNGTVIFTGQPQFKGANQIRWYDSAGNHRGYCGPVFYGATDPASWGAQDGSIWFQ